MIKHTAVYNTHPTVVSINGKSQCFDSDGNEVVIDETKVSTEITKLEAERAKIAYRRVREREYPPIGDQLDALWKGGEDAEAMKAIVNKVKSDNPKG